MSCCQSKRTPLNELVNVPENYQAQVKEAMSGAQKIGMAVAIGSLLFHVFTQKKPKASTLRKKRSRSRK